MSNGFKMAAQLRLFLNHGEQIGRHDRRPMLGLA